jgi:DNA/RNA-binding domain of Phe-tRNA-synthetase-like protein
MIAESVLPGWALYFSAWEMKDPECWDEGLIAEIMEGLKQEFTGRELSADPVVQTVRKLFHRAGTDPTKYRPSFEALARRMLKGEPFPRVHAAVDFSNLLSLLWHVPCCVADREKVFPPVRMRVGGPGETVESLRGPFHLEGKILMEDSQGIYSTPITDSKRAGVGPETKACLFVAYFPEEGFNNTKAQNDLGRLLPRSPVRLTG